MAINFSWELLFTVIILTKILYVPSLCREIVFVVVLPCFCFLRNGKSILDPKGDFHKKYLIIITILRDDDLFRLCFCFYIYFFSFCFRRMHKEWTIFLWFLLLLKTISNKVFKVFYFIWMIFGKIHNSHLSLIHNVYHSYVWLCIFVCISFSMTIYTKRGVKSFWWKFCNIFTLR